MSLEVKSKSKILINLPFIILALVFIVITARLYFWEDHYYKSKEGNERMLPKSILISKPIKLPWMKLQFLKIRLIHILLPTISLAS